MTAQAIGGIAPLSATGFESGVPLLDRIGLPAAGALAEGVAPAGFQSLLSAGLDAVNRKVADADTLVRQFALDDSVAVHRVTFALEEARLSVEFAMQVRARLVEAYRDFMTMQL